MRFALKTIPGSVRRLHVLSSGVTVALVQAGRRGQDANLREPYGSTRFPSVRLKPLGHLSLNVIVYNTLKV